MHWKCLCSLKLQVNVSGRLDSRVREEKSSGQAEDGVGDTDGGEDGQVGDSGIANGRKTSWWMILKYLEILN